MGPDESATIKIGDYVIVQKQKYFKLHQLNSKCDIVLGKDKVNLRAVVGRSFWTTFKMLPTNRSRDFDLEVAAKVDVSLPEAVMRDVSSGTDNRHITDDGKSQLMSTDEIVALREGGLSAQNIVGKLIESSTTFKNKTEYSQEKYLKKKEKKYFEYIVVRPPTVRLLADIFYNKDQSSVMGLRYDSIAQILSYSDVQSRGTYLLFESGTQALLGAAMLNCLSEGGHLINLSAGKFPPKQAILGMNFSADKMERFMNVRLADFIGCLEGDLNGKGNSTETSAAVVPEKTSEDALTTADGTISSAKRKIEENDEATPVKRPKWMDTFDKAVDLVKTRKVDGLVVACKEYPVEIVVKLLGFVKPSRQIVVYSLAREPLVKLYSELKATRKDVVGLHLYENWFRNHQVLVDRTHPDVTMSASGGHILVATKVSLPN